MAKKVQTTPGVGGRKKPSTKPAPRTRAKRAKPAPVHSDSDLEDDIASLRAALAAAAGHAADEEEPAVSSQNAAGPANMGGDYLDFLTQAFRNMGSGQWDANTFDSMTGGAALVMGSGPAFATLGSMMAGATAQSAILMNATQTQRQLDQVGLCCTSACVKQLLSLNNGRTSD